MTRLLIVCTTACLLAACGAPPKPSQPKAPKANAPSQKPPTQPAASRQPPKLSGTVTHASRRVCMVRVDDNPDNLTGAAIEARLPVWVTVTRGQQFVAEVQAVAYEGGVNALLCMIGPKRQVLRIGDQAKTTRTVHEQERFDRRHDQQSAQAARLPNVAPRSRLAQASAATAISTPKSSIDVP